MQVKLAETPAEIRRCFPVMVQLRPQYTEETFLAQVQLQSQESGYQLAYVEAEPGRAQHSSALVDTPGDTLGEPMTSGIAAVAGFVVRHYLSAGHVLYVDDLVTHEALRSGGYGAVLLDWLYARARSLGCDVLDLDSGVQRFDAHRFYFRSGMHIHAYHFRRRISAP
jgi:GNAT superfamily N-acetyltransferase